MSQHWRRRPSPHRNDLCYIAVKPCGCVVEAVVIRLTARFRVQTEVGRWLMRGWLIGRVSVAEATYRLTRCEHDAVAVPDPQQLALV